MLPRRECFKNAKRMRWDVNVPLHNVMLMSSEQNPHIYNNNVVALFSGSTYRTTKNRVNFDTNLQWTCTPPHLCYNALGSSRGEVLAVVYRKYHIIFCTIYHREISHNILMRRIKIASKEWRAKRRSSKRETTSSAHRSVRADRERVPRRFASHFAVLGTWAYLDVWNQKMWIFWYVSTVKEWLWQGWIFIPIYVNIDKYVVLMNMFYL